jgi:hypothetical protein
VNAWDEEIVVKDAECGANGIPMNGGVRVEWEREGTGPLKDG